MALPQDSQRADTVTQKKQRLAIKAKINAWKKEGFLVSDLELRLSDDFEELQEMFFDHVHDISILEKSRRELDNLNTQGFEERVEAIRKDIFTPSKADEVKREVEELKKELMITIKNVPDLSQQETRLRKELERIRKEEIERIKREEIKKIRIKERERLIREAEKRLRRKEGEKIKQQEKERQTWIRHLKETIPETKKESTVKRVKTCPSCKGKIPIESDKRPLRIKCGKCGREYTLRGGKESKGERPLKRMKCPKCRDVIEIFSNKRPLKVNCGGCGKEFTLKGKQEKKEEERTIPPVSLDEILGKTTKERKSSILETKSYGAADKISTDLEEKDEIECPHCGSMVPPEFKRCGMCGGLVHEPKAEQESAEERIVRPEDRTQQGIFAPLQNKSGGAEAPRQTEPASPAGGPQGPEEVFDFELPSFSPDEKKPGSSATSGGDLPVFKSAADAPVFKEDTTSSEFPEPFITDKKEERKGGLDFELPAFTPEKDDDELVPFTPDSSSQAPASQAGTNRCPHCGNELPPGASFCGGCGNKV